MRIKKILAFLTAVFCLGNCITAFAAENEKVWTFDFDTSMPDGFSYNNQSVNLYFDEIGADGSGAAMGILGGVGIGRGNGEITAATNGVNIDAGHVSGLSEIVVSYDFLIKNNNINAALVAPRVGAGRDILSALTLNQGTIEFMGNEISTVLKDEWHSVGVLYNLSGDAPVADVYFDNSKVLEGVAVDDEILGGFGEFSVLVSPKTSTADYRENISFEGRNEKLFMDNLYVGGDKSVLSGSFRLNGVQQGDDLNKIIVTFNRSVDTDSFLERYVVVLNNEVVDYSWNEQKNTLTLTLSSDMTPKNEYTVKISPDIACADSIEYSGDTEAVLSAALPKTINKFWSFDDQLSPPEYFTFINKTVPVDFKKSQITGEINDYALRFLIGIGAGSSGMDTTVTNYTNGFYVLKDAINTPINDVDMAIDYDFSIGSENMIGRLIAPSWGSGTNDYAGYVEYFNDGNVYFEDNVIGRWKVGEWHNVGMVLHLTTGNNAIVDVYYDSVKMVSDFQVSRSSGLKYFAINSASRVPDGSPSRFDERGEYLTLDNLYVGADTKKVVSSLKITDSTPAENGSDISIDTPISVTFNEKIGNDSADGLLVLTDSHGNIVPLVNASFENDGYTIAATPANALNYDETYTLSLSDDIISENNNVGEKKSSVSFKTKSNFDVLLNVDGFLKENGTASASVSSDATVPVSTVMAAYDKNGVMVNYLEGTIAPTEQKQMSVSCGADEKACIFIVDSVGNGVLLARPFIESDEDGGYHQNETAIDFSDVKCENKTITVSGNSNLLYGYALCKIAKSGKELTDNTMDSFLNVVPIRTNALGEFSFSAYPDVISGNYNYSAKATDISVAKEGNVSYEIMDGNSIKSMSLSGESCTVSGSSISLTTSSSNISGMLVKFETSPKASVYLGSERLESGASRINAENSVTLCVVSEWGDKREYTLSVTKKTATGGGGSSSGGGGGGNTSYSVTPQTETFTPPEPIEEETALFSDVPKDHWAAVAIEKLAEKNIITGVTENIFLPERLVSREEFAVMLYRAFSPKTTNERIAFDDVESGAWYEEAIYALGENKIINGIDTHLFGVGEQIKRQDMCVMIARCIENKNLEKTRTYEGFADEESISEYAYSAVVNMYEMGIVNGMENNMFMAENGATRAQVAYILSQLI